ncbi:phospholipase A and acyltransferase 1 isoform X1 [Pogona vitticeps]
MMKHNLGVAVGRMKEAGGGCSRLKHGTLSSDPQQGDLIEIFRPFYKHWAVYVGNGYVVHLASADGVVGDSLASSNTKKALVKIDRLLDACAGDQWRVNNKHDNSRPPKSVEEIVHTALSCVGKEISYNVLLRNCEHFATFIRYDEATSEQAVYFGVFGLFAFFGLLMGLVRN